MAKIFTQATFCVILIVTLSLSHYAFSQTTQSPFSEFGYAEQTVIYGPKAGTVFYFKHRPRRDYENSYLHLEILASQLINRNQSTLTFLVGDQPVFSAYLSQFSDTIKVDLPLKKSDLASGFVKLELKSNLFLQDENCRDYDETAIWLDISPNSFLLENFIGYPTETPNWAISEFLPEVERILISESSLQEYGEAAAYLHFFFREKIGVNLPVQKLDSINPKQIHRALILGKSEEIQSYFPKSRTAQNNPGQGALSMYYGSHLDSITQNSFFTSSLLLSGSDLASVEKAIYFLFNSDLTSSAFTDFVMVNETIETDPVYTFELKNSYQLDELGVDDQVMSGIGKIRRNYTLPSYLSKANLRSLQLQFKIDHKPVSGNESAYANFYINNDLIGTYRLNESGVLLAQINPTRVTFATGSYLGVEFIYTPEGGSCNTNATEFYAQIDPPESYLNPVFYPNVPLTFASFPKNFEKSAVEIIYDFSMTAEEIPGISQLIELINNRYASRKTYYFPKVTNVQSIETALGTPSHKIILTDKPEQYQGVFGDSPYIRFFPDSVAYRSDEIRRFFNLKYGQNLAFIQLFSYAGQNILMVSNSSRNPKTLQTGLQGVEDQFLTNSGNVLIADQDNYYFFDLRFNTSSDTQMNSQNRFLSFWETYRVFIIILVIAFIIVLLSYVFKKSETSKKNIEDARH